MHYIFLITATILTFVIHYHYYRWGVLTSKANRPAVYRSPAGTLIVILSKIVLFITLFYFSDWSYILITIITLFVFKLLVAYISIFYETKEYMRSLKMNRKKARDIASQEIKKYYRESLKFL